MVEVEKNKFPQSQEPLLYLNFSSYPNEQWLDFNFIVTQCPPKAKQVKPCFKVAISS